MGGGDGPCRGRAIVIVAIITTKLTNTANNIQTP